MPRESKPLWHKGNRCWYARVGATDDKGRSRPVYFNKPLRDGTKAPRDERDQAGAWAYLEALRRLEQARWVDTADPTVTGLAELYLKWCEGRVAERTMSPGHFRTLQTRLGKFAGFDPGGGELAGRRARAVSVDELELWVKFLKGVHKPHYVKNCVRAVQGVYAWAARDVAGREPRRLLERNPLEGFRAPGAGRMPERFAERLEAAAFLHAYRRFAATRREDRRDFEKRTILLERVLIRTGCRPGEACRMRWDQIRWEGGTTTAGQKFARVVLGEHKTAEATQKNRVIYLTPLLTRALRRLSSQPGTHPVYVFTHARGTRTPDDGTPPEWGVPWDAIALARKVREVRRATIREGSKARARLEAGAELGPVDRLLARAKVEDAGANRLVNYRWRHTAISTLLMMGVDTATVAELTGTSPEMVRLHYGHLLDSHLSAAAEKLVIGRKVRRSGA